MNKTNGGFTLIETLLAISAIGVVSAGLVVKQAEKNKEIKTQNFFREAYEIVRAVDHRIAIDGYDPVLWTKTNWNNEKEIVEDLIAKQLTSESLTNCKDGEWNPVSNSNSETRLISCKLWNDRKNNGEVLSAELVSDSAGFIQSFNLYLSYSDPKILSEKFLEISKAIDNVSFTINQEISGSHYIDYVSTSSKNDITIKECIKNFDDCSIRFSVDRNGGNEYVKADGSNSMIGEHLTFIDTKGQAPMKCVRWSNTARDGSGAWTIDTDEECGIGIYKDDPHPVMVDVVADSGTFKNVLLDQECKVYAWNGSNVVDTGNTSPCGVLNDGSEIVQVVDNIRSKTSEIGTLYAGIAHINNIFINNVVAETIESKFAYIEDKLKADVIESYNQSKISINSDLNVNKDFTISRNDSKGNPNLFTVKSRGLFENEITIKDVLKVEDDSYFNKNTYVGGNSVVTGDISSNQKVSANTLQIKKINVEESSCTVDGEISRATNGSLLNCVSGVWKSVIAESAPIGSIMIWTKSTPPNGWIELDGQSTAAYPQLRAIIGNYVPDFRGQFVRAWDHGKGIDAGRGLGSYQYDAIRNIEGSMLKVSETWANGGGTATGAFEKVGGYRASKTPHKTDSSNTGGVKFDASNVVPTANENRPKNISVMYIIKAY
ncbi:tail fiber protein [Vibrio sp. OPT18]|nr:tail fiber protein [Vibrio sp. OPT18]MBE8577859.1 tail fiber protein [Vibrio sp. OPT18]